MANQCLPGPASLVSCRGERAWMQSRGAGPEAPGGSAPSPRVAEAGARRGQSRGRAREDSLSLRDTRIIPYTGTPAKTSLGKRRAGARHPGAECAAKRGFHGAGSALRSGSLLWTRDRHEWARQLRGKQV